MFIKTQSYLNFYCSQKLSIQYCIILVQQECTTHLARICRQNGLTWSILILIYFHTFSLKSYSLSAAAARMRTWIRLLSRIAVKNADSLCLKKVLLPTGCDWLAVSYLIWPPHGPTSTMGARHYGSVFWPVLGSLDIWVLGIGKLELWISGYWEILF